MDFLIDLLQWLLSLGVPESAYYIVISAILLACGLGLPIPEDITLILAGLLVYLGLIDFKLTVIVCLLAVLGGDSLIFYLGSHYGRRLSKKAFFRKILPEDRLQKVSQLLNERGTTVLFFARFMPGLRAPVYFSAGLLHVPFTKFLFYDGMAALISVPAIIALTDYFGDTLQWVIGAVRKVEHLILLLIVVAIIGVGFQLWKKRKKQIKN